MGETAVAVAAPASVDMEASVRHCRWVARTRARNFYYAFQLLDRQRKDAMCAVYAFMRYADDVSDELDPPVEERRRRVLAWREALGRALEGDYGEDRILPAFHDAVERYSIPPKYFYDLMDGVESDLAPQRMATFDELYTYCYRVASVVGMTCTHIFGFRDPEALALAERCGIAFQLTNILRDVREDAEMGRVYLPAEDLERFQVSLVAGQTPEWTPEFRKMAESAWLRASALYDEARPLIGMVDEPSRPALWALIAIYRGLLERIREQDYDVLSRRPRLTKAEKLGIVARAMWSRWRGGTPPFPA